MKTSVATISVLLCAFAQPSRPVFEAASVKPSKANTDSSSWNSRPGYLVMRNQTLKPSPCGSQPALVRIAYQVKDDQISGGPKWIDSEGFDIEARAAGPSGDPELLAMLQTLLTERFQLGFHRGAKAIAGYSLVAAKGDLKIRPDESVGRPGWNGFKGKIVAQRVGMAKVAESLSMHVGGPVVDATGIKGVFSFTLEWTPETRSAPAVPEGIAPPDTFAGPSLFAALQQQLGLKLETRKDTVETFVIDKLEKPSEN